MTHPLALHAFLDIETTGLDAAVDEIIEVGVVAVDAGGAISRERWLVRPTREVPPLITALTGLDGRALVEAPAWAEVRPAVEARLSGYAVVAHNASFERSFLGALLDERPLVDSCELTHLLFPELASHALDALVRWAGVREGARHRALEDADDTLRVVEVALERASERATVVGELLGVRGRPTTKDEEALQRLLEGVVVRARARGVSVPAAPPEGRRGPAERARARLEAPGAARGPGFARGAGEPPEVPEDIVRRAMTWLEAPGPVAVEAEGPALVGALALAARRLERDDVVIAVPSLRGVPVLPDVPAVLGPGERACRSVARELLPELARAGPAQAAAASFLWSWVQASPRLELRALGLWALHRWPDARWMAPLIASLPEGCASADCPCQVDQRGAATVVVTHQTALRWLARGVRDTRFVFLEAHRLPEAIASPGEAFVDAGALERLEAQLAAAPTATITSIRGSAAQLGAWLDATREGEVAEGLDRRRLRSLLREIEKDVASALAGLDTTPVGRAVARAARRLLTALDRLTVLDSEIARAAVRSSGSGKRLALEASSAARGSTASALVAAWALFVGEAPAEGDSGWLPALGLSGLPVHRDRLDRPSARVHRLPEGTAVELAPRLGELVSPQGTATSIVLAPKLAPAPIAQALLGALPNDLHLRLHLPRGQDGAHRFELRPCTRPDEPSRTYVFLGAFTPAALRKRLAELPPGVAEIWVPADAPAPGP